MVRKSCDLLPSFSLYFFLRKTRVADFNTSFLQKLAYLPSFLASLRNDFFNSSRILTIRSLLKIKEPKNMIDKTPILFSFRQKHEWFSFLWQLCHDEESLLVSKVHLRNVRYALFHQISLHTPRKRRIHIHQIHEHFL